MIYSSRALSRIQERRATSDSSESDRGESRLGYQTSGPPKGGPFCLHRLRGHEGRPAAVEMASGRIAPAIDSVGSENQRVRLGGAPTNRGRDPSHLLRFSASTQCLGHGRLRLSASGLPTSRSTSSNRVWPISAPIELSPPSQGMESPVNPGRCNSRGKDRVIAFRIGVWSQQ